MADSPNPVSDDDDATLNDNSTPATHPSGASHRWPARIGHYVTLQELGRGGMGVVCAAYDPVLDRKVAIKLLHSRGDAQAQTRLIREAQALARLSHPNVVQIYEIGEFERLAFIVMEYVDGLTLRDWLRHESRSREAMLAVFDAAGRGLAAAHAQGLVHRDFKPDNVMIRHDGRVLVMDFGLARGEAATTIEALPDGEPRNQLEVDLTRTGTLLGTPAYMAPEQFRGIETDAKTDQFAFCVAAWEALTGARPFVASNLAALSLAVTSGNITPPPPGLPSWIRKHLERGLATEPSQRWPSMDELLAALRDDPTRRRRAIVATLGLIAISLGVVLGVGITRERERTATETACDAEGQAITEDWTADDRAAIEQAFLRSELPTAADTWKRVQKAMDRYAQSWTNSRTNACREARVTHERAESDYAAIVECLDQHRTTFATLIDTWHTPTRDQVSGAAMSAAYLPPLTSCTDPVLLAVRVRLPDDPETREQVAALRHRLQRIHALVLAVDYQAAHREAEALLADAEALGWPPLVAEVRLQLGSVLRKLGRFDDAYAATKQAFAEAGAAGNDLVALESTNALAYLLGHALGRPESGLVWTEINHMLLDRLDLAGSLHESKYLENVGILRSDLGDYQAALDSHTRALELREAGLGADTLELAQSFNNIGINHLVLGNNKEARVWLERSLAIREQLLGPNHTVVAGTLDNLGIVYHNEGEVERARATFERAWTTWSTLLEPGHIDLAIPLGNLAGVLLEQEDYAEALTTFQSVLAIQEGALGSDHPDLVTTLANIAQVQRNLGDHEGMLANYARATELLERHLGPNHPRLIFQGRQYGTALASVGRHEQARVQLERALAISLSSESATPDDIASIRFALAQSLWELGERKQAREQATTARDMLPGDAARLEPIIAWLQERE